jgi:transcriptional regulator with XRE-family HTH domain
LANLAGIHKAVISKIENGDTKRPEWKTIKAIASILDIPYEQLLECYMDVEQRPDVLLELISEAIGFSDIPLASKVALKFLESPREDTYTSLERLYTFTGAVTNTEARLSLYNLIVTYARERGVPPYIAKGLLQQYLIERLDLKRLEESFRIGEEIIHYAGFLSREEQIVFYFRMALHAHNTKRYKQCIEFCKAGLALETAETELTARAFLAMINSYLLTGNYDPIESLLPDYESFGYDFVEESAKFTRAIVKAKKGEYDQAIPMLKKCLEEISKPARIHVINELLEIYLKMDDFTSITELIEAEDQFRAGKFDEGLTSYLNSIRSYGNIRAYEEITASMRVFAVNIPDKTMDTSDSKQVVMNVYDPGH